MRIVTVEDPTATHAEFMVLHERRIGFEGRASELLASPDAYLNHSTRCAGELRSPSPVSVRSEAPWRSRTS